MEIDKWYSIEEAEKELRDKATYRLNGKTKAASILGFDFSFKNNILWITWPNGIDKTTVQDNEMFRLTSVGEVVILFECLSDRVSNAMADVVSPFRRINDVTPEIGKHLNDFSKEYGQKPPEKERFDNAEVVARGKNFLHKKMYVSEDWCPLCFSEKPNQELKTAADKYWQDELWSWLNNENREPALTAFSAGRVRDIAREIELQLWKK